MQENKNIYFLYPSNIFVSKDEYQITTILGSCIAVCMWDKKFKIGGMNHYMLPIWGGNGLASPKYGDIAIEKLYKKMLSLGSSKNNIVVKIFGGASVLDNAETTFDIPGRNIRLAYSKLNEMQLKISKESIGGKLGRKILFETSTGIVRMRYIKRNTNKTAKNA